MAEIAGHSQTLLECRVPDHAKILCFGQKMDLLDMERLVRMCAKADC